MATERKEQETMTRKTEAPVTLEELRTLFGVEQAVPVKTWRPTTGGLLEVISGYVNILQGIFMLVGSSIIAPLASFVGVGTGFGILLIVLGIVSVIGGSYAIRRRSWGMALAGAITALFPSLVMLMGTLSLIFVTLGKPEFKK